MVTKRDIRLGGRIKRYRKQAGLRQKQLSEMVGVTEKYIQLLEDGRRKPSLKVIYKLAKVFGLKVKDLFPF